MNKLKPSSKKRKSNNFIALILKSSKSSKQDCLLYIDQFLHVKFKKSVSVKFQKLNEPMIYKNEPKNKRFVLARVLIWDKNKISMLIINKMIAFFKLA